VPRESVPALKSRHQIISTQAFEGKARLRVLASGEAPGAEFLPAAPSLEDYYFSLVSQTPEVLRV
jgi:hypothetical protein